MTLQLSTSLDDIDDPDVSQLVTEDDTPVDNLFSEKQQRLLTESLYASWAPGLDFVVMANVGLFFSPDFPPLVPDVLLSLDVRVPENLWQKKNRSYFTWKYGKPPDMVIEIVSNREGHETNKIDSYARQGIGYYVISDPGRNLSDRTLRAFELHGIHYAEVLPTRIKFADGTIGSKLQFANLHLGLTEWDGAYEEHEDRWLRWTDADGAILATGIERARAAELASSHHEQRAEAADQRAEAADQRAEAERVRAERLTHRLRELGLEE